LEKCRLVHEQGYIVAFRPCVELLDRHAAVVIMITQGEVDRGHRPQTGKKQEEVRQPFRHVQEVSRDEDPMRLQIPYGGKDLFMPRLKVVEMEIALMHGPMAGEDPMGKREA